MFVLGIVLFLVGVIVAIVGFIWALIQAFSEHVGWGLAYWFIPFAALAFHIIKWNKIPIRRTFFLQIGGFLLGILGSVFFAMSVPAITSNNPITTPKSIISSRSDISSDVSVVTRQPLSLSPSSSATSSPSSQPQPDKFSEALDRGMGAAVITQSAVSKDDWNLIASEWQSAIQLLKAVPQSSPNYAMAQKKIPEYQRNLVIAQQKTVVTSGEKSSLVREPKGVNPG